MVCFVVSGAAGLVYEVVWTQDLRAMLGNTLHAVAAVLAAFMGGMAAGSWMGGRLADRLESPLQMYVRVEILIGLYALAFPVFRGWNVSDYVRDRQSPGWHSFMGGRSMVFRPRSQVGLLRVPWRSFQAKTGPRNAVMFERNFHRFPLG